MTNPINNFQDILDAMERDPDLRDALRRHILTEELLHVPARLERMEGDIGALKEDVSTLKEDVSALKEGQARLEEESRRTGGRVSRLAGDDYESHAAAYAGRFLRRGPGIEAAVISTQRDNAALRKILDGAEKEGLITPAETDDADLADLVLASEGPTEYILAEVSITVQQDDVDKAARRARILARATGKTVAPLTIGAAEEQGLRRAEVLALLIPERQAGPQPP